MRHAAVKGGFVGACIAVVVACGSPSVTSDSQQEDATAASQPERPPSTPTQGADASAPDTAAPAVCQTAPPNDRCGLAPQCGCANNETCDVTNEASGATSCVTSGGATLGRPCNQTGDCLEGLACVFGACRPYCKTPRSKCDVAGTDLCVEVLGSDQKPITNKAVCTITCDPRAPAGVCGTNACHWFDTYYSPSKVSDCNFGGTTAALSACQQTADCQPGLACIQHPKYGLECEKWCRLGQVPSDCGPDPKFKCKDVFGDAAPVVGGVKEGVCQD